MKRVFRGLTDRFWVIDKISMLVGSEAPERLSGGDEAQTSYRSYFRIPVMSADDLGAWSHIR